MRGLPKSGERAGGAGVEYCDYPAPPEARGNTPASTAGGKAVAINHRVIRHGNLTC